MIKKLFIALSLTFLLSACGAYNGASKVKQITLGMTKEQVISIMGNNYKADGAIDHPDGVIEIISYHGIEDAMSYPKDVIYFFRIQNGKLIEWYKDYIGMHN